MGNSPAVSGPERGGAHVERDITIGDHLARQKPASYNAGGSDNELADDCDEHSVLETNRKSHFEIITEQPNRASHRKSSDENAPRSSTSYTSPSLHARAIIIDKS